MLSLCVSVEAAGGKALACVVDIRDEQQIGDAVQKAVDKFGGNAIFLQRGVKTPQVTCSGRNTFKVRLLSPVRVCRREQVSGQLMEP